VSAEQRKQQCELKAMDALAPALKRDYPQLKICWLGDALWACGRAFQIARVNNWSFVFTFKEGRLPALWKVFQTLLKCVPQQVVTVDLPDGTTQEYRWVNGLDYQDSEQRRGKLNALQCREKSPEAAPTLFAWVTGLPLNRRTVVEVATKAGRPRWMIENEGFNWQKNSGMRLEHVYSSDPDKLKVYYLWLQIAHLLLLLMAKGSLLRQLTKEWGKSVLGWFGSWGNLGKRLLESLRNWSWPAASFDRGNGKIERLSLDSTEWPCGPSAGEGVLSSGRVWQQSEPGGGGVRGARWVPRYAERSPGLQAEATLILCAWEKLHLLAMSFPARYNGPGIYLLN